MNHKQTIFTAEHRILKRSGFILWDLFIPLLFFVTGVGILGLAMIVYLYTDDYLFRSNLVFPLQPVSNYPHWLGLQYGRWLISIKYLIFLGPCLKISSQLLTIRNLKSVQFLCQTSKVISGLGTIVNVFVFLMYFVMFAGFGLMYLTD